MRMCKKLLVAAVCVTMLGFMVGPAPQSQAGPIIAFPNFFPPFNDTGTIVEIGTFENPNGDPSETCIVFRADSNGALYFFNGVDSFAPGTRLKVKGNLCTICLVQFTCNQPVSPILNAVATPI